MRIAEITEPKKSFSVNNTRTYSFTAESNCVMLIHGAYLWVTASGTVDPTITLEVNGIKKSAVSTTHLENQASANLNRTAYGGARSTIWIVTLSKGDTVTLSCNFASSGFYAGYIL